VVDDEAVMLLRRALVIVRFVEMLTAMHVTIADVDVRELRELIERYLERIDSERDR
jgi:hypothetical protein